MAEFPAPMLGPSELPTDYTMLVRTELLRAISADHAPDPETHRRIAAWCAAAAPNSLKALRSDLRIVETFQRRRFLPALPLRPVELYSLLGERSQAGHAKSSLSRLVASMVRLHQLANLSPCVDDMVKMKLREIRRQDSREVRQARGLRLKGEIADFDHDDPEHLSVTSLLAGIPEDAGGLRDRALISTAYDAGLRRSEVVRIQVKHIDRLSTGEGSLFIPRSKTDQTGEGARAWLSRTSIACLDAWLAASKILEGYVFRSLSYRVSKENRLRDDAVSHILKRRVADHLAAEAGDNAMHAAEIADIVRSISSHSLRVGCDQDLFAAGVDLGAIMQGLRWRSPKQPLAYARHLGPSSSKLAATMRKHR